ncbi:N-acetyltransferase, partial [Lactobacillus salivarius]|nr:N-acetyltransferase [Ligilactobacillus salivarius]
MKEVEDLIIRKLSSNDLNDFREIITQKEVARMAGFAPVSSFASFYLSQMLQNGAWGLVVNKKVVGVICIYDLPVKNNNKKTGEIG